MFNIHRIAIICSAFSVATAFSPIAFATEGEKTITLQEDAAKAELIRLNVSAGDVEIVGTTGNSITAVVTAVCQQENRENCEQMLKDLAWSKKSGSITEVGLMPATINRYDHITVKVKIGVPKSKNLEVNLSAGELHLDGTSACLTANVNAGQINLHLKEIEIALAELSAKVGDVKLTTSKGTTEGNRSLLVGANLTWNGSGACHTKASVMAGEVHLTID